MDHGGEQRAKVERGAVDWEWVCVEICARSRELFQPHSGLTLKSDFTSKAEQCCGRVEEPPYRSCLERANFFVDQVQGILVSAGEGERGAGTTGESNEFGEKST